MYKYLRSFNSIKSFKPFIIGLTAFSIINTALSTLILLTPLGGKLDEVVGNRIPVKVEELRHNNPKNIDVLALGTSMTAFGFLPKVFEESSPYRINSFNMGIPGTRPDVLRAYLDYHIRYYSKPKVLLIEVSEASFSIDNYYRSLHYAYLVSRNPRYLETFLTSPFTDKALIKEMMLSSFSGFYHYRGVFSPFIFENKVLRYFRLKSNHLGPSHPALSPNGGEGAIAAHPAFSPNGGKGSVAAHSVLSQKGGEGSVVAANAGDKSQIGYRSGFKGWETKPVLPEMLDDASLDRMVTDMKKMFIASKNIDLSSMEYLLDYCKEQKIQVVLVSWPNHPRYIEAIRNSENYRQFQSELNRLSAKYDAPLITFDIADTEASKPFFESGRHLSSEGAAKFTKILAEKFFTFPETRESFIRSSLVKK